MKCARYLLVLMIACSSPVTQTEANYTARLLRCIDQSATLAESKACRQLVDAQFKIDGGK